jgi:hypothetical protein
MGWLDVSSVHIWLFWKMTLLITGARFCLSFLLVVNLWAWSAVFAAQRCCCLFCAPMWSLWPLCQFQLSLCLKEWYLSRLVRFSIWRWHSYSEELAAATLRLLLLRSVPTCTVQSSTKTSSAVGHDHANLVVKTDIGNEYSSTSQLMNLQQTS